MNVAEKIRGTYENARGQIEVQIAGIEARATELEKRAKASFETQLRAAWVVVLDRVRELLDCAPRHELVALTERVNELQARLDHLLRSDQRTQKIRELAEARVEVEAPQAVDAKAPSKSSIKAKAQKTEAPKKAAPPKRK